MAHPFFDALRFPRERPEAQALVIALAQIRGTRNQYTDLYVRSWPNPSVSLTDGINANLVWLEIFDNLTTAGRLSNFCDVALADVSLVQIHPFVRAIQEAPDVLTAPLLRQQGLIFFDRKPLRSELQKLVSARTSPGVLLVRGPAGSGKSWSELIIDDMATSLGAKCVYVFAGLVSTVQDVVAELFTALGRPQFVTPQLTTDDAWFRQVCLDLQDAAQAQKTVYWVVADDLGNYPTGPRLDPLIRQFFDQFALRMANPAFAQWFRLVLLDYPEGDVPTRWRANVWVEDRPTEGDVGEEPIIEFLRARAEQLNKQLGEDTAKQFASDILAKVNNPTATPTPTPRLKRIHDEVKGVLARL